MGDSKLISKKILELLAEVESYQKQKDSFLEHIKELFSRYQAGQYTYFEYTKEQEKILKKKTKEETINAYNAYIYSLLKRIEKLNEQLFYGLYNDNSYKNIAPSARTVVKFPEIVKVEEAKPIQEVRKELIDKVRQGLDTARHVPAKIPELKPVSGQASHKKETKTTAGEIRAEQIRSISSVEKEKKAISEAIKQVRQTKEPAQQTVKTVKQLTMPEPVITAQPSPS